MVETYVLMSLLISTGYRFYYHDRMIMSTGVDQSPFLRSFLGFWGKITVSLAMAYHFGANLGRFKDWYQDYGNDHSLILMWLLNVLVLATLFLVKESSYEAQLRPKTYNEIYTDAGPLPYKINMLQSLGFNTVFYLFLMLSPTLPFLSVCILRKF